MSLHSTDENALCRDKLQQVAIMLEKNCKKNCKAAKSETVQPKLPQVLDTIECKRTSVWPAVVIGVELKLMCKEAA